MVSRLVVVCAGVCLLLSPAGARAQDAGAITPPANDLEAFARRIEGKIDQLQSRIDESQQSNDTRLASLEEKVRAMSDVQESNRQTIEQIAQRDSEGTSYLRINTSHEPTKREFLRAMSEALPTHGTVTIKNTMAYDQIISINGKTVEVIAGDERDVTVPLGNYRVKLPGQESQFRYVGPPAYASEVLIRPRTSTSEWRSPPIYWNYVYR